MADNKYEIELELLKKEVQDMKKIHVKLDTAIETLTDATNCVYRMLSVHEEKITRQEEDIVANEKEIKEQILDLHSRINTSYKELRNIISTHEKEEEKRFDELKDQISNRIGILEKWRWIIMGGSIVAGFILHKLITFPI